MACGDCGCDEDDEPKWWSEVGQEPPDDPNSFMGQVSNALGDLIDGASNLIIGTLILLGGTFVRLAVTVADWAPTYFDLRKC